MHARHRSWPSRGIAGLSHQRNSSNDMEDHIFAPAAGAGCRLQALGIPPASCQSGLHEKLVRRLRTWPLLYLAATDVHKNARIICTLRRCLEASRSRKRVGLRVGSRDALHRLAQRREHLLQRREHRDLILPDQLSCPMPLSLRDPRSAHWQPGCPTARGLSVGWPPRGDAAAQPGLAPFRSARCSLRDPSAPSDLAAAVRRGECASGLWRAGCRGFNLVVQPYGRNGILSQPLIGSADRPI